MLLLRIFAPSVNVRLFDPMPLPRKSAALRRERIAIMKEKTGRVDEVAVSMVTVAKSATRAPLTIKKNRKTSSRGFTYTVKKIPVYA